MNKKNLIVEIILAILITWLIADKFSNNQTSSKKTENKTSVTSKTTGLKIAYVNVDSLLLNYKYAIKLNEQFQNHQKQSQMELNKKMATFQKNYKEFQDKVKRGGFLSQASAKAQQNDLVNQQNELEKLNKKLSNSLASKQQELNAKLYNKISDFVTEYNKTKKYNIILSNTLGGTILYANKGMNITKDVLIKLNEEYDNSN